MTVSAQILLNSLKERGVDAVDVWYEFNGPLSHYSAWYFKDQAGNEFLMGRTRTTAMLNIMKGNFEKMEN